MSKQSEEARSAAKSKAERLVRADPTVRVDASGYRPDGALNADVAAGMRPVSRRAYRRGGKVDGEAAAPRADRKPRKSGGSALTPDSLINRNVKDANEERGGITFTGGLKKGGRVHKDMGGLALPNWADSVSRKEGGRAHKLGGGGLSPAARMPLGGQRPMSGAPMAPGMRPVMRKDGGRTHGEDCTCAKCGGGRVGKKAGGALKGAINDGTRPVAGRLARKGGGRTKGTNVNIIISPSPGAVAPPAMPPRPMPMAPPGGPVGLHQGAPPPPPMAPPAGAPPPMPMARKSGGRAGEGFGGKLIKPGSYPIDSGAGGGLGRLEKAKAAARG
jgi:hypothetical protein